VYYVSLEGTGALDPLTTGYSSYASVGKYSLSGTLVLAGDAPANPTAPTIASSTGSFGVGATITATSTAAHWTGSPVPKLTFQWQKLVGLTWTPISGAAKNTFKLTANETGYKVRIAVTGTNTYGATTAYSDESAPVS
jgi:hypothetical protein